MDDHVSPHAQHSRQSPLLIILGSWQFIFPSVWPPATTYGPLLMAEEDPIDSKYLQLLPIGQLAWDHHRLGATRRRCGTVAATDTISCDKNQVRVRKARPHGQGAPLI